MQRFKTPLQATSSIKDTGFIPEGIVCAVWWGAKFKTTVQSLTEPCELKIISLITPIFYLFFTQSFLKKYSFFTTTISVSIFILSFALEISLFTITHLGAFQL